MDEGSSQAVTWLLSVGIGGFLLLCGVALLYEKSRKKLDHPQLGRLTYEWGSWSGSLAHYKVGNVPVRFLLPGSKRGPEEGLCQELLEFWKSIETRVQHARDFGVEEFREIEEAYDEAEEAELMERILSDLERDVAEFDNHWLLIGIVREDSPNYTWALEFHVAWDEEHTRTAYFDSQGGLRGYFLTCTVPWDDD
ncbi:MAG: hypothetical protein WC314_16615 [Vulcanimicrobiota bacterium]